MWIPVIAIAWLYVAVLMAVAEATHAQGTVLGAVITFGLYGLLPLSVVLYILDTPRRKRALRAREESVAGLSALDPDAGGHAAAGAEADGVAPVRKEP